jgi:hypothetical protein
MGILNLLNLVKKNSPDAIKAIKLSDYKDKRVACDASMV